MGKTVEDGAHVDVLLGVIADAFKEIRGLFWNKEYETVKAEKLAKVANKFDYLQTFIGDK